MSVLTSSSQDLKLGNSADNMPGILLTLCVTCSIVTSSFVHTSNCRSWHGCKTDSVQVVYILVSLSAVVYWGVYAVYQPSGFLDSVYSPQ